MTSAAWPPLPKPSPILPTIRICMFQTRQTMHACIMRMGGGRPTRGAFVAGTACHAHPPAPATQGIRFACACALPSPDAGIHSKLRSPFPVVQLPFSDPTQPNQPTNQPTSNPIQSNPVHSNPNNRPPRTPAVARISVPSSPTSPPCAHSRLYTRHAVNLPRTFFHPLLLLSTTKGPFNHFCAPPSLARPSAVAARLHPDRTSFTRDCPSNHDRLRAYNYQRANHDITRGI
jgi:hypothetical protein